ncbi:hypothetical protein [uncultured Roseovarius sp.]|uniref:hypothetical protein n=1 Tax=uncultured Roseovarius sp. TaxID=293344 RepID=UPI00262D37B3|nr:hypothetical protein [uncultured Roseovarius sp.]
MSLTEDDIAGLFAEIQKAMPDAFSCYSEFKTGCAVMMGDGGTHRRTNIENTSFGAAICAECSAISGTLMRGLHGLSAVCVINPPTPRDHKVHWATALQPQKPSS